MSQAERKRRKRNIVSVSAGFLLADILLLILHINGVGIPCVFYEVTGLHCPGCGNTRAVEALIHLDIPGALACNYLFPLELAYLVWVYSVTVGNYYKTGKVSYRSPLPVVDILILAAVVIWGVVRNVAGIDIVG